MPMLFQSIINSNTYQYNDNLGRHQVAGLRRKALNVIETFAPTQSSR